MKLCAGRLFTAFMCAAVLLHAAGSDGPHWLKIRSTNFELFTTAGERNGREVARHFEQVRAFFLEAMGLGLKSGLPVRIVVFRSNKEFAPYSPNELAAAFYLGTDDHDYIIMKGASGENFPVAVHEYTHLLVKHSGTRPPVWFNEGLAEFYSNLKPQGGKVEVGAIIMPHYALLRQSHWIDLPALLAVEQNSPLYNVKSQVPLFYAESWALVHMLYLGDGYRPKLRGLLEGIKAGASMADTFQKTYGKTVAQVEADLRSYMGARRFNASLFDTRLAKAGEPETTEACPLETGLVLAEIMASTPDKAAQGRELYNGLARDNPKEWRVEEGLARLSRRERNIDEAMQHYGRAAELGGTNARMYLDYGRLLRVQDMRGEAVAVLKRATEIDPDDRELRLELGYAYVVNDQHAEALTQFQLAKPVDAEHAFEYLHAMAYAYYRLGRRAEGKATAATCRGYAKTTEQVERLNQLVTALNYEPHEEVVSVQAPPPQRRPEALPALGQLQRRAELAVADGTLKQIDCMGGKIRMRIGVGAKVLSFAVLDPSSITMKKYAVMDFACGPQKPRRIKIEYETKEGAVPGTMGVVRSIEFPD